MSLGIKLIIVFRTTSETAQHHFTQNYSDQERKEWNTPGYNQRLKYNEFRTIIFHT